MNANTWQYILDLTFKQAQGTLSPTEAKHLEFWETELEILKSAAYLAGETRQDPDALRI